MRILLIRPTEEDLRWAAGEMKNRRGDGIRVAWDGTEPGDEVIGLFPLIAPYRPVLSVPGSVNERVFGEITPFCGAFCTTDPERIPGLAATGLPVSFELRADPGAAALAESAAGLGARHILLLPGDIRDASLLRALIRDVLKLKEIADIHIAGLPLCAAAPEDRVFFDTAEEIPRCRTRTGPACAPGQCGRNECAAFGWGICGGGFVNTVPLAGVPDCAGEDRFSLSRYVKVVRRSGGILFFNHLYQTTTEIPLRGAAQMELLHILEKGVGAETLRKYLAAVGITEQTAEELWRGCILM